MYGLSCPESVTPKFAVRINTSDTVGRKTEVRRALKLTLRWCGGDAAKLCKLPAEWEFQESKQWPCVHCVWLPYSRLLIVVFDIETSWLVDRMDDWLSS